MRNISINSEPGNGPVFMRGPQFLSVNQPNQPVVPPRGVTPVVVPQNPAPAPVQDPNRELNEVVQRSVATALQEASDRELVARAMQASLHNHNARAPGHNDRDLTRVLKLSVVEEQRRNEDVQFGRDVQIALELSRAEAEAARLRDALGDHEVQIINALGREDEANARVKEVSAQLKEANVRAEKANARVKRANAQAIKANEEVKKVHKLFVATHKRLQDSQKLERIANNNALKQQQRADRAEANVIGLTKRAEGAEADVDTLDQDVAQLQKDLTEAQMQLRMEITTRRAATERAEQEGDRADKAEGRVRGLEQSIERLQGELADVQGQLEASQALEQQATQRADQERDRANAEGNRANAEEARGDQERDRANVEQGRADRAEARNQDLTNDNRELAKALTKAEASVRRLQKALNKTVETSNNVVKDRLRARKK